MKKIVYFIIVLFLHQSCSNVLLLTNRTFINDNPFKTNSLHFINDSVCIYEQVFLCDVDDPYKETKITCRYEINKKKIVLSNIDGNSDTSCFRLPETEIKKCNFLNEELSVQKPLLLGAPRQITKIDAYGYIDNITIDTLLYKNKTIYYKKWNYCAQFPIFTSIPFYERK